MNATRRRTGIGVMIAIVIVALVAACQATGIRDKTGGDTTVLRLVTFEGRVDDNGQNYGLSAFVDNLRKVSGGRLKVDLVTDYGGSAPDAESRVVRAIASGQMDGGWPSTRAFADAGRPRARNHPANPGACGFYLARRSAGQQRRGHRGRTLRSA